MADTIDATIAALHDAGASDDEITGLLKEKFGKKEEPGSISRFVSGVARNANPIGIIQGAASAVMHPQDTYNALVEQSSGNFREAKDLANKGEYGHALHHGVAAVIPPYNIVTHAGDEMRKGNTAGGVGEAVGAGITANAPAIIKGTTRAVVANAPKALSAANTGAKAVVQFAEKNPAVTTALGGAVGYAHGGVLGAIEGAAGGGFIGRLLRATERLSEKNTPAPVRPRPPVPQVNPRQITSGQPVLPVPEDPSFVRGVPAALPAKEAVPGQKLLTEGRRVFNLPHEMEDSSYVRAVSANGTAPGVVAPPAPASAVPGLPFKLTKVDVARITALDKELGSAEAARTLRHDPRFATMTAPERVAAIRQISTETPQTLPAKGMRAIDEKFNAINPLMRAAYVETWKTVNPAVYTYLQSKLR